MTPRAAASQTTETAIRALLAVALYAAFPPFSDIYRLWRRAEGIVPSELGIGAFEYPPLATLTTEVFSWLPSSRTAVVVNGLLMAIAAVAITRLLETDFAARQGASTRLWVASPAVLLMLPINLDVAAVLFLLMAVVYADRDEAVTAGGLIGVGVLVKVFPGSVVLPLLGVIREPRARRLLMVASVGSVAVVYLVYALVQPDNWLTHVEFASVRSDFASSPWGVIDSVASLFGSGLSVAWVNGLATATTLTALLALTIWAHRRQPTLSEVATLAVLAFMGLNKVFKPQYVLWLLPLLALIGARRRDARLLEATAIVDFVAIYFALPGFLVPLSAAARTAVLCALATSMLRRGASSDDPGSPGRGSLS